jgi:hypothetical protein
MDLTQDCVMQIAKTETDKAITGINFLMRRF